MKNNKRWIRNFTITAKIHARSLANFYSQYADRHMNLKIMQRFSGRERAIRQFVIVKKKLISVCNASVLLLTMNFVITLSITGQTHKLTSISEIEQKHFKNNDRFTNSPNLLPSFSSNVAFENLAVHQGQD